MPFRDERYLCSTSPRILLGDGIRLYDNPSSEPILLERSSDGRMAEVNVRFYRPVRKEGIE